MRQRRAYPLTSVDFFGRSTANEPETNRCQASTLRNTREPVNRLAEPL